MKIFKKVKTENRVFLYIFDKKVLSYKKRKKGAKTQPFNHNRYTDYLFYKNATVEQQQIRLQAMYFSHCGYYMDFNNPVTFNEKIQWLKLFYQNSELINIVDKYTFKEYIKNKLGDGYTVPLITKWANPNDINLVNLPKSFVLKSNCQSSGKSIIIVRDKSKMDLIKLKMEISDWLMPWNGLMSTPCWAYQNIKPMIIVENYVEQIDGGLNDYKFFCYNGEAKHILICKERGKKTKYINKDINWKSIKPSPNSFVDENMPKPSTFEEMKTIAKKLSKPFPFVRVDFYEVEGKVYVGELTFYSDGGYNTYYPEYNKLFGSYLTLPAKLIREN